MGIKEIATDKNQMKTDEEKRLNGITEMVIGCAFKVHNALGGGFAEKIYENALVLELREAGLAVQQQVPIVIRYRGIVVGEYIADIVVEGIVLIENKAVRNFDEAHVAQCLNYLALTVVPVCLLLNFGRRVDVKRFRNDVTTPRSNSSSVSICISSVAKSISST